MQIIELSCGLMGQEKCKERAVPMDDDSQLLEVRHGMAH